MSDVCQRDVAIATSINRPIISLVIGKTKWPPIGKVGESIKDSACFRFDTNKDGGINFQCENFETLKKNIKHYLNGEEDFANDETVETLQSDIDEMEGMTCNVDSEHESESQVEENFPELRTSVSMLELKSKTITDSRERKLAKRRKTQGDLFTPKSSLPEGVEVDIDGYTIKSARSKSCAIL